MDPERQQDSEGPRHRAPAPRDLLVASTGGIAAAVAAGAVMGLLRWVLQVRTIPERLLEWALLLIPPDQFEAALQRFGQDAKRYALYAAIAGLLLLLATLGAHALRRRWSSWALLALGVGLWLVTMLVIMPLTDAGFFAVDLIDGTRAAVGGYLAIGLFYAGTLALASLMLSRRSRTRITSHGPASPGATAHVEGVPSRRAALLLLGGAIVSLTGTYLAVRLGLGRRTTTRVVVLDPQEPVPSGGIDPPNPHPNLVATPLVAPSADVPATADSAPPSTRPVVPTEQPASAPGASASGDLSIPEPPQGRQLVRDKDGAVLPSGRPAGELAEMITGTDNFYVVTKNAAGDPALRAGDWRLRIDGDVERVVELDIASLRNLPSVEVTKTLECISNFVDQCELAPFGCDLISTARWKGARLGDVLGLAGAMRPDVVSLSTVSADEFTTALPLDVALAPDTLLVYEMNGQALPREHGFPARILVPGRYGMKSAKWVVALRPLRREFIDWYGQRNWSKQGIVKTMTRIDSPGRGATLPPGEHRLAGIAYAGDRGIGKVEFSEDDGTTWQAAELLDQAPGPDTWVRWQGRFTLKPGAELTLVSRATDGTGALQVEDFSLPQPDGSSGWHHSTVRATA